MMKYDKSDNDGGKTEPNTLGTQGSQASLCLMEINLCHECIETQQFSPDNKENWLNHMTASWPHIWARMGSIPVWRISMEIISTHTTSTSLVVPIRAYKRLNIFAILSFARFLLDLNIKPPRYMNTSQRGTSIQTNTWTTLMHSAAM